jgi:MFS transporter, SP family, general alpha glucoside:H+ symporter
VIIGVWIGSIQVDRMGYKWTMLSNLLFLVPWIGLVTFSPNLGALTAGEILCGLQWGIFSTMAVAYASEVCPLALRGYLTTLVRSRHS